MFESNQHAVATLYLAYLDRAPDADGLAYWTAQLDAGASYFDIARAFGASAEAQDIYPELRSDSLDRPESFVFRAIENIFDRDATDGDIGYWAQQIRDGKPTWQVLAEMPLAAQNGDSYRIDNTIDVSLYFTDQAAGAGIEVELPPACDLINGAGITYDARVDTKQDIHDFFFPEIDPPTPSVPNEPEPIDGVRTIADFDDIDLLGFSRIPIGNYKGLEWDILSIYDAGLSQSESGVTPGYAHIDIEGNIARSESDGFTIDSKEPFSLDYFRAVAAYSDELNISMRGFLKNDEIIRFETSIGNDKMSDIYLEGKFQNIVSLQIFSDNAGDIEGSPESSQDHHSFIIDDMTFYL